MNWKEKTKLPDFATLFFVYKDNLFMISLQDVLQAGWNKWWRKPFGYLLRQNIGIKKTCGIYTERGLYYFVDKSHGDYRLIDIENTELSQDQQDRFDILRKFLIFLN